MQGSTGGITMLTRIDHVMICVPDLQQGIDAYTRILPFRQAGLTSLPGSVKADLSYQRPTLEPR